MRTSIFRVIQTFRANYLRGQGGPGTGDQGRGTVEQVEVRDPTSNTLDSIGYTPLGLIFLGGQGTRDQGQWEQVEVRDPTSNTLDSIGYTPLGLIFLGGQGTGDKGPGTVGTSRGKRPDIEHIGLHWIHTFRVDFFRGTRDQGQWEQVEVRDTTSNTLESIGYTPLGLIFLGGQGTGDKGPGTVGTSRGKRHDIEHIGIHWIHTFRINFFRGTGDKGPGTVGTSRGKRPDIEHIGIHWTHTFRINFLGGTGDRGQGTGNSGNK